MLEKFINKLATKCAKDNFTFEAWGGIGTPKLFHNTIATSLITMV